MTVPKSKLGAWIAGAYLLLVVVVCAPLIIDGAIHHGNGIAFLGASLLTLPLSWIAFRIMDSFSNANAFYMIGAPYYLALGLLLGCAVVNAIMIYLLVGRVRRKSAIAKQPTK